MNGNEEIFKTVVRTKPLVSHEESCVLEQTRNFQISVHGRGKVVPLDVILYTPRKEGEFNNRMRDLCKVAFNRGEKNEISRELQILTIQEQGPSNNSNFAVKIKKSKDDIDEFVQLRDENFSLEQNSSHENLTWRKLLGRTKCVQLEKGITFAMKSVGKEQPEDPIERFSDLLLLLIKQGLD